MNSNPLSMRSTRFALAITVFLLTSGFVHLAILGVFGTTWHGPLSFRKPALFGISGGMTMWSLAWLMTQLSRSRFDRLLINAIAISLFIEVSLITAGTIIT